MLATGATAKSLHNPFRSHAEPVVPSEPSAITQTDLETHPASLERSPSPAGESSRSSSPEPAPRAASPTNASSATDVPDVDSAPSAPQRTFDPPPGPPPVPLLDETIITEDLPPAYTPTADVRQGETSVEFGPRRPFGTTSSRPHMPWQRSQRPSWQPAPGGSLNWSGYPGTMPPRRLPPGAPLVRVDPPPQHPALTVRGASPSAPRLPPRPLSDFARDFYAAGSSNNGGPGADDTASDSPGNRPATPPRPDAGGSNAQNEVPDDGRPTNKPVPGHPLLNSGKVLVYPAGYECPKCHNTGYKHFDPSNPCTKCWSKYAKAYAGPLTYAPWTPASGPPPTESHAGHNLQRPLPHSQSPSFSTHPYSQSLTDLSTLPPHPDLGRSSSTSRQYAAQPRPPPPPPGPASPSVAGGWPPASWLGPSPSPVRTQYTRAPPPGATVVRPGDPRIGGRLCWRCGGSGITSFLIFDEQTCTVCSGLGRTF